MDIGNVVAALKQERGRIDRALAALGGLSSPARRGRPPRAVSTAGRQRRGMSAAARKRVSEAMKQRWAKWKGVLSQESQDPPCDECRRQEEIVGFDESALGCEEEARLVDF